MQEGEAYLGAALAALQATVRDAAPLILQQMAAGLQSLLQRGRGGSPSQGLIALQTPALLALLGSAAFRPVVITDTLITSLATFLAKALSDAMATWSEQEQFKVWGSRGAEWVGMGGWAFWRRTAMRHLRNLALLWPGGPPRCQQCLLASEPALIEYRAAAAVPQAQVLQAIDAVCSHAELLVVHHAAVLTHLLPALSAAGARLVWGPRCWGASIPPLLLSSLCPPRAGSSSCLRS